MAIVEIKIPSPGESITHVELARWLVKDGDVVRKESEIAELESDKATLMLVAEESGKISIKAAEGDMIAVGDVACSIDTSVKPEDLPAEPMIPVASEEVDKPVQVKTEQSVKSVLSGGESSEPRLKENNSSEYDNVKVTPLAKKMMEEGGLSVEDVINGLRRLKREDVEAVLNAPTDLASGGLKKSVSRESKSERMSSLRRKLSERLVSVKNETAMLTTFNEVDMKPVMDMRKKWQTKFVEKHGIKLGMMSFFLKACSMALHEFPNVNAMLDGENIVTFDYADISVAVSTPKGLMVPVIRNVESLGLAEIERALAGLAEKARSGKISVAEMSGGTFTVTNGGVFGSMMSTPLINPPQSAILGMHNIIERPIAIDGQVVVRPMMYIALSYDHRIIDGRESVGFLVRVKQLLENPTDMMYGGGNGEKVLLEI